MNNNRKQSQYLITLTAITLVGALLRIWGWAMGSLTHDELSAIGRLGFDTLGELIRGGVYPDGHPAGVQVFLWMWTNLFGNSTLVVRLPFLLMGIACIPLMARVARMWTNRKAAVFAASVMAVSQYGVYFSMLARPYVMGLFCMLTMLCFWIPMVVKGDNRWKNVAGLALSATACAYCHQFAMLSALLTAIFGLVFCNKKSLIRYLIGCAAAVVLFAPHIPITWHQLTELKGVGGWLSAPDATFARDYIQYLFHYSPWLIVATVGWIAIGSDWSIPTWRRRRRATIIALMLWILPMAIGYGYSVWVNPVLQYSCLIFSWPMLILAVSGMFSERRRHEYLYAGIWLSIAIITLWIDRKHEIHYRQIFESGCQETWECERIHGADNTLCWIEADSSKLAYYERRYGKKLHNLAQNEATALQMDSILDNHKEEWIVVTGCNPYEMEVVRKHYPFVEKRIDLTRSTIWVRSKKGKHAEEATLLLEGAISFDPDEEFTPIVDTILGELITRRSSILKMSVDYDTSCTGKAPYLVMETLKGDKQVDYQCEPIDKLWGILVRDMAEVAKRNCDLDKMRVKIYLWNPEKSKIYTPTRFRLEYELGNPYEFGVEERIQQSSK